MKIVDTFDNTNNFNDLDNIVAPIQKTIKQIQNPVIQSKGKSTPETNPHSKFGSYDEFNKDRKEKVKKTIEEDNYENHFFGNVKYGNIKIDEHHYLGTPDFDNNKPLDFVRLQKYKQYQALLHNTWKDSGLKPINEGMTPAIYNMGPLKYMEKKLNKKFTDKDIFEVVYNNAKFEKIGGFNIDGNDERTIAQTVKAEFEGAGKTINKEVIQPIEKKVKEIVIDPVLDEMKKILLYGLVGLGALMIMTGK